MPAEERTTPNFKATQPTIDWPPVILEKITKVWLDYFYLLHLILSFKLGGDKLVNNC